MILKIKHKKIIYEYLIDDEDFNLINQYNWYLHNRTKYVRGRLKGSKQTDKFVSMHRAIMKVLNNKSVEIDHKNHNKLDNRKENLRICNRSENTSNRTAYGVSKYLGVCKFKDQWKAGIGHNGKNEHIGIFKKEEDAAKAYDKAAKKYHGEFANLNFK
jgi:hypothetical protein